MISNRLVECNNIFSHIFLWGEVNSLVIRLSHLLIVNSNFSLENRSIQALCLICVAQEIF